VLMGRLLKSIIMREDSLVVVKVLGCIKSRCLIVDRRGSLIGIPNSAAERSLKAEARKESCCLITQDFVISSMVSRYGEQAWC
jgi:hypothetical protein